MIITEHFLMKPILLLFVAVSFAFITHAQTQVPLSGATTGKNKPFAEWSTLRADNIRDGRMIATGEFKNGATLRESIDYSTTEAYVELLPGKKKSVIQYTKGKTGNASEFLSTTTEWQTEQSDAYIDLYGDGKLTRVTQGQNLKYSKLFEGDNKYYRIQAIDGFGTTVNVDDTTFIGIRVYEGNTSKLVLEKKFPKGDYMQRPHVTVADMNNDGQKDIVITSWEGIYVFNNKGDSIAGLSQNVPGWHHLRKRGFASLADIDGNGYKDVVIISSLPWHCDVIKNDHGVLKFGWTRIFDGFVETASKISKPILNSVSDFDGDGTYEVFVNVYNYNDDKNWSGVLFDATNGNVKAQIKDAYVLSAEDVNNDGKYIFFCTETQGQSVPLAAALKVVTFSGGETKEIFQLKNSEWINPRIPNVSPTVTTHSDGISRLAEDAVLCVDYQNTGHKVFFAKADHADGSSQINGYYVSGDGTVRKTDLSVEVPSGMYGEIVRERKNADGTHNLLLQVKAFGTPAGTVKITGADSKDRGRYISSSSRTFLPIVTDLNADGSTEILIPDDVGEVLCFGKDTSGKRSLKWKVRGRGMIWQYSPEFEYGVAADDIDHDGDKEVIVSGSDDVGSVVSLYDHNGKLLWKTRFPEINGGEITMWDGNVSFYATAQSSKRKNRDVIVTVQRGIAHGGQMFCLSGTDGTVLWKLDRLHAESGGSNKKKGWNDKQIDSGAGGYVFSVYDIDGDGSDEVMCGYGNIVFFADCTDGSIKFKAFMRKVFLDKYDYVANGFSAFWMQQITPVPFYNQGKLELSCFNTMMASGSMDTKGVMTWAPKELPYKDRYWQCMANLDGDGKLWVVELSTRNSDNVPVLFAYSPVDGADHKTFSIEMPGFISTLAVGMMPVACDVNGDGRDEIVVSNSKDGIYCIGNKDGKATILWKYLSPGCGPVVIADEDSDGSVEIITATQNGKILILDK